MKKKILVVDDDRIMLTYLTDLLIREGYEVATAENGRQALRIFNETKPSIVFTDIKMPGMDGIELLQKIKEAVPDTEVFRLWMASSRSPCPVIMITSVSGPTSLIL